MISATLFTKTAYKKLNLITFLKYDPDNMKVNLLYKLLYTKIKRVFSQIVSIPCAIVAETGVLWSRP
jgi:hypothetical protein